MVEWVRHILRIKWTSGSSNKSISFKMQERCFFSLFCFAFTTRIIISMTWKHLSFSDDDDFPAHGLRNLDCFACDLNPNDLEKHIYITYILDDVYKTTFILIHEIQLNWQEHGSLKNEIYIRKEDLGNVARLFHSRDDSIHKKNYHLTTLRILYWIRW